MHSHTPTKESPAAFFGLTFLLSLPFYILNALAYQNVLFEPEMGALYISLFTLTPITSASILTYRRSGRDGMKKLLGRIFDFRRIERRKWYAPILFLVPLFFFILAAGEEVGWMGYAFEPMQS
jgi:hypothetical protein